MGKAAPDATIDAMLEKIATAERLTVLTDEPANFAAIAGLLLAEATLTPGDGNDFTIGDGDVSGRKVTVSAQEDMEIDATGEADHVALDDGVSLIYVTTCTPQQLTQGGTVTAPAWDIEVADPV